MPVSRSAAIAAELRRQIELGELPPGAQVPSTREITRRWGVAMATATKVLTELKRDGLVSALPGVGTIVVGQRTAAAPRSGLTLERIVATAIEIADAEGIAGLSMRRLATDLGTAPMSLYRHLGDKDMLVLQMIDRVASDWQFPPPDAPAERRARIELAARTLWAAFRRHTWLASALSLTRPQPAPNAMPFTEWILATLDGTGLDLQTRMTTHLALFGYIRGMALNLEMEADAEAASGLDSEQWLDTQHEALESITILENLPNLQRLMRDSYDFDLDALFEFGLQRMLDGIDVLVERLTP